MRAGPAGLELHGGADVLAQLGMRDADHGDFERVAAYKYPRHVWLVRELPKGPTCKILHREMQPPQDLLP